MGKDEALYRIRHHWASYIARGGIEKPKKSHEIGKLGYGGIEHWALFLKIAIAYLRKFPKERHVIEGFVPAKTVKLLVGE